MVSVIVPNYNHAHYLEQRLNSILNQTFQDFEIILLDDCSTDNSREIIERYTEHPKVSEIIYNEINGGTSYKQWYKGIQYAKGELIWIAESDDLSDLRFLESTVPHFDDTNVSLVFSHTKIIYSKYDVPIEKASLTGEFQKHDGNTFIKTRMLGENGIYNGCMVVFRKEKCLNIRNDVRKWNEMKFTGDWLLWILLSHNSKVVELKDELNYWRIHNSNASNQFRKMGYDIIEGLDIFVIAKKLINNQYDKIRVYNKWGSNYVGYMSFYSVKTKIKVKKKFCDVDLFMYLFVLKQQAIHPVKRFIKKYIMRK